MEFRPNKNETYQIRFQQEDGSMKVENCHRYNTSIYKFSHQPEGDHIFIVRDYNIETGLTDAVFVWKLAVERAHNEKTYQRILKGLGQIGVQTVRDEYMEEADRDAFRTYFGRYPVIGGDAPPEAEPDLTPRQENRVAFLGHLLTYDMILPNDFHGEVHL